MHSKTSCTTLYSPTRRFIADKQRQEFIAARIAITRAIPFGLLILTALFLTGCQAAHIQEPLPPGWSNNDAHARMEYWSALPNRAVVGNDEVFHGLLLYLDGVDPCTDYAARVSALKARKMLPGDFKGDANDIADRGTLAVALVRVLKIDGGVSLHLFGDVPRYAVRSLEYRGVYPPSSPNQAISGGQFVGIMEKAEEYERGSPADAPAAKLPSEIQHQGGPLAAAIAQKSLPTASNVRTAPDAYSFIQPEWFALSLKPVPVSPMYLDIEELADQAMTQPFFLDDAPATRPATAALKKMNVIITGVEGELAEVRKSESGDWIRAKVGMVLHDSAEFRTGPKSAIRFIIPPDQTFALDSQGTIKVLDAVASGNKEKTDIGLVRGRVRYDVDKSTASAAQPVRIEQAGIEHDASIRSPNSALALRGTKVSLFDQPGYDPEAISLTGAAIYINTRGQRIPFGGTARAAVSGAQRSATEQAAGRADAIQSPDVTELDFENRETEIVAQRGGFVRGDVVVGDLHLSDFHNKLPGALDFVLQWTGTPQHQLNDLNLAVFSPLNTPTRPDFVANPPFIYSLTPNSPVSKQVRATSYPAKSPSGGVISKNSFGPDGLELASWPSNYPVGTYHVVVFNLLDAKPPPTTVIDPVTYTIDVFLHGRKLIGTYTNTIGFLQTSSALAVQVPATTASATPVARPASPGVKRPADTSPKICPVQEKMPVQRGRSS